MKKCLFFLFSPFLAYAQDLETLGTNKPLTVSGSIDVRGIVYSSKGIPARRSPFMYLISGSPTLSIYGFSIPVYFSFSEQDRSFRQPFNQFGMSPTYKWITLHVGYRNLTFSPYTLAGHTLLGGGFELTPGKWRLAYMMGRLNRATRVDTLTGKLDPQQFSRYGYAAKVGYGTAESYIDLSFLSAKDRGTNVDSSSVRPAANAVVATEMKLKLGAKFHLFADGALSVYTHDRYSTVSLVSDSLKTVKNLQKILPINGTSEHYLAYSGGVGYRDKTIGLNLAYRFVAPEFKSMGAYFFQNDLQSLSLSSQLSLLKGKFRFNGSLGVQEDNVRLQKQATTRRVIVLSQLSWDLHQMLGLDATYVNYATNSAPTVTWVQDRYLLTQTTSNYSLSPRIMLVSEQASQFILLSYNSSYLKDLNSETKSVQEIHSNVALLNYTLGLNKLGLSLNTGVNHTSNKMAVGEVRNTGFTLGLSKGFLSNKLLLSTQNSYTLSSMERSTLLNLGGSALWQPEKSHKINLRISSLKNPVFSEFTAELGYTYSLK